MAIELDEFYQEFFQDVMASADAAGAYAEDSFFSQFCEYLMDSGELETADRAFYSGRGLRVDGYGGDPVTNAGELCLVVADFSQSPAVASLTQSELDSTFKRPLNFLTKALDPKFRNSLEETDPGFGLADLIAARWPGISKVRIILISNRLLSGRVEGRESEQVDGTPVSYSVWDIGRLHRLAVSRRGREEIVIDLESEFGGAIPILPAHLSDAGYEAYLAVVPGAQLAAIYDQWGARLLEQNVRVFLQARGNVNKGIRNTLDNDPDMFFAYNNGVTATAEGIETRESSGGLMLTGLRNLQIVNGGQTTASIHAASRKKGADLSKVFVQMKLSIVAPERTMEVVPKISEYANSQNKVNAADFFANHPFHVRMEDFSRRLFAPSPDGTFRESKWFYERARGQFQDERGKISGAARRKFDLEYPKQQLIAKTDLAKFLNVWREHPDVVSKGAQKNFAHFAMNIGREWTKSPDEFNESFFREAIAKAIIFRATEKLVTEQSWYQGGYRANIVAHAISKIAHDVARLNLSVSFEKVWKHQALSNDFTAALELASKATNDVLTNPPSAMSNVTEWAKSQACWSRVKGLDIIWPEDWLNDLLTGSDQKAEKRSAVKDQRILNGIEAQKAVVNAGSAFWKSVREWAAARKLLTPMEQDILDVAAAIPNRLPSDKQCLKMIEIIRKMIAEGYQHGGDFA
jgi:AIPR protein